MDIEFYQKLKKSIQAVIGINLDSYKDEQMRRRLDAWLVRSGAPNWDEYLTRVKTTPTESTRFRDYLTINVTEFFRDIDKWIYLQQTIFPELIKTSSGSRIMGNGLKIWSAGCSIGAESYTLAMIMDEMLKGRNNYLLASDLDRGALAKANAGGPYTIDDIKNVSDDRHRNYFKPGGPPYYIDPKLSKLITFKEHNLLADPYEKDFDLIICRNVIIYFTSEAKDHIFKNFKESLRMGGILFLGGTEIIPRPQELGFVSSGISYYKRVN